MNDRLSNVTPLLKKYLSLYQKNPTSRVFAPLAETYRKMGNLQEAYKILQKGISSNPDYLLGYLTLAQCFVDEAKYQEAYTTIRPFIARGRDNITLQKLFARVCDELGHIDESLETNKYLLFLNPSDKAVAERVEILESGIKEKKSNKPSNVRVFNEESIDNWVEESFTSEKQVASQVQEALLFEKPNENGWEINHHQNIVQREEIINFTLVDLYLKQGYRDKAIEVCEKILELNPSHQETLKKLRNIKENKTNTNETDQQSDLMKMYDRAIKKIKNEESDEKEKLNKLESVFSNYISRLKIKAQEYA